MSTLCIVSSLDYANRVRGYRLKHFGHPELHKFRKTYLDPNFHIVFYIKPDSSRAASNEGYWLCFGFNGVTGAGNEYIQDT